MRRPRPRLPRFVRSLAIALVAGAAVAAKCYGQSSPTPTAREILDRFVAASGGDQAISAITSRVVTGKVVTPAGSAPMEIIVTAPDHFLRTIDSPASGHSENGYDGARAWTKNRGGVREMAGPEVGMVLRELHLHRALALRTFYRTLSAPRADTLGGVAVFVIDATTADGSRETLYFDRLSGLLSGWDVAIGEIILKNRLSDYRVVDGVRLPFKVTRSRPGFSWSEEVTSVAHNVAVDTTRFAKPAG